MKTKNATHPSIAEHEAAIRAEDAQLWSTLETNIESFVRGTQTIIGTLVKILASDAWTRVDTGNNAPASFRAFIVQHLIARGIPQSQAAALASSAEGAYQMATLETPAHWQGYTQSVLANIGRAKDPTAAAAAVVRASKDSPKGKRIGDTVWSAAIALDPTACATRNARTSSKSKSAQLADRALQLADNDFAVAKNLLAAAGLEIDAREKAKATKTK